jgi:hypothetical protein
LIEITIVLTIMSVDMALVIISATTVLGVNIPGPVYILTFSPSFGIVEA